LKTESLFMNLCRVTTPHGHEAYGYSFIPFITEIDPKGNAWTCITRKDVSLPNTMFSCHLDTAGHDLCLTGAHRKGTKVFSNGKSILGADDKVGATVMIKMIEANIPGFYVFHVGEERGGVGSGYLSKIFTDQKKFKGEEKDKPPLLRWVEKLNKCVAWDRRNTGSIITHQGSSRTCSDAFGTALAEAYGMGHKLDTGGTFTDTKNYRSIISECTNISAGFFNEHMNTESVDIEYVKQLVEKSLKINWEELPTSRDYTKEETKSYSWERDTSVLAPGTLVWLPYTDDIKRLTKARQARVMGIDKLGRNYLGVELEAHADTRYLLTCVSPKKEQITVRREVLWVVPEGNVFLHKEANDLLGEIPKTGGLQDPKTQPPVETSGATKAVNLLKPTPSSSTVQETSENSLLLQHLCPSCRAELDQRDVWMGQCLQCRSLLPQWYLELRES